MGIEEKDKGGKKFMVNIKNLRKVLEEQFNPSGRRVTIERKKKMVLEEMKNGNIKSKRRTYLKIEIIE